MLLPDMDGLEVLRRAGATLAPPPVILISGGGTIASAVSAMKLGAQDFLEKPIDMVDLLDTIQSSLLGVNAHALQTDPIVVSEVAKLVMLVARADHDIRRVIDWARLASLAPQTLFSRCARVDITAKQALDLGRLLRIGVQNSPARSPSQLLDSVDNRTIAALAQRAGIQIGELSQLTPSAFLRRQALLTKPPLIDAIGRLLREGRG